MSEPSDHKIVEGNMKNYVSQERTLYDEFPYLNVPHHQTSPSLLGAIATLFGIKVKRLEQENVRILEIGCAQGGNIIPLATLYPNSEFIGIDLSEVQINEGLKAVEKLDLKNIRLIPMSVTNLDMSFGTFDYIICHGLFSWVPEFVRNKILNKGSELLAENGVMHVSYNTYPGWNGVKSIRDLMLFHTQKCTTITEKIKKSEEILRYIAAKTKDTGTFYEKSLEGEIDRLNSRGDIFVQNYILHDLLGEENKPFYFHEFIKKVYENNLEYLSDCNFTTIFTEEHSQPVKQFLSQFNDYINKEQYLDYISNRRFRNSILVKNNLSFSRIIQNDSIHNLYFSSNTINIYTDNPTVSLEDIISPTKELKIKLGSKSFVKSSDPFSKTLFKILSDHKDTELTTSIILNKTSEIIQIKEEQKINITKSLTNILIKLLKAGVINITCDLQEAKNKIPNKPKLWKFAQYQVNNNFHVITNRKHTSIQPDVFQISVLKLLNGNTTVDEIQNKMIKNFNDGEFDSYMNMDEKLNPEETSTNVKNWVNHFLISWAKSGFFES